VVLYFAALWPAHAVAQTEVILGADNPGGSYYLYGGGLSNWINQRSKVLRVTSQTTRGSVENARLLNAGRLSFGLVNAIATYQQRRGIGQFKDQQTDSIRGIAVLDVAPLHIVTYPSSGIKTLQDLAGKRVSIGAPGSGSATAAGVLFPVLGIVGKVKAQNLGFNESASNLRDGNLDAFMAASALPMPAVVDLTSTHEVTLIPTPPDVVDDVRKDNPPYQPVTIPANTYSGIKQDVPALGLASLLVARADVPDDVVYELVSQMFTPEALTYMRSVYRAWDPAPGNDLFKAIDVPLHPGALRFYREKGLIK
jgi:TRAP transporter TAXI family solute receptor